MSSIEIAEPRTSGREIETICYWPAARSLFLMAAPIAASQFLYIVNAVVDSVMAGHLDVVSLAAISAGVAFWAPASMVLAGFLYVLTPLVAERLGENKDVETGGMLATGLIIGLGGGTLLGLGLWFGVEPVFRMAGVAPDIVPDAVAYVRWVALGFPGCGLFVAFRFLIEGFGRPLLVTLVATVSAIVNATLNYGFMYGGFGLPALGAPGCGTATAINFTLVGLLFIVVSLVNRPLRSLWRNLIRCPMPTVSGLLAFLGVGSWVAFNLLSDYAVMTVVGLGIARIDAIATGAHQIAFNVLTAVLVIPIGLSMAATVLVARAMGARNINGLKQYVVLAMAASTLACVALAAMLAFFPATIASQYTTDGAVIAKASTLLYIAYVILPIDGAVICACFLLRGMGDMKGAFFITFIAHWGLSLPIGFILSSTPLVTEPMGAEGWWLGLAAGLVAGIGLAMARLRTVFATTTAAFRSTDPVPGS